MFYVKMFDCMEIDFEIVWIFCKLNNNLYCDWNCLIVLVYVFFKLENWLVIFFLMFLNILCNFCILFEGIIWLLLLIIYFF